MKKLLVILVVSLMTGSALAQERDALCTWTTVSFDKSFGKWSAGLMSEYRHVIRNGVSKTDQYFARPGVAYKALPWLTLRYQADLASTSSGFNIRFIPEVSLHHKIGDFSLSFRQRAMTTWKVEAGTNSTVLRTRAKVDYNIAQSPVSVLFAFEPYWCEFSKDKFAWFQKARWYAGFNVKVLDNLTIVPQYVCQAYHNSKGRYNRRTYDDHVIYVTFQIKL